MTAQGLEVIPPCAFLVVGPSGCEAPRAYASRRLSGWMMVSLISAGDHEAIKAEGEAALIASAVTLPVAGRSLQ